MNIEKTKEVQKHENKLYKDFTRADTYIRWFTQPHTILALLISGGVLIYAAFTRESEGTISNAKYGFGVVFFVYILICALHMRDGLFVRPHPVIWRIVSGISIFYLLFLVFILFQTASDVRLFLSYIDPSLGKPLPERSYAENCEVWTPDDPISSFRNIKDTLYDEFVPAHFLGWFGKAIMLRDYWLCWALSILFEILEISLQHLLPNFAECWWDHVIVDILVCNFFGMLLGLKMCQYFQMKPYHWVARVSPELDEYRWEVLSNWKRLFAALLMLFTFSVVELNAFFLKFVLWIPPPHPINVGRLFLWWAIGQPGLREFYQWVTDPNCKRFGTASWLCAAIMGTEALVWIKFGKGMFPNATPPVIFWGWTISAVVFLLWAFWYFGIRKPSQERSKKEV